MYTQHGSSLAQRNSHTPELSITAGPHTFLLSLVAHAEKMVLFKLGHLCWYFAGSFMLYGSQTKNGHFLRDACGDNHTRGDEEGIALLELNPLAVGCLVTQEDITLFP